MNERFQVTHPIILFDGVCNLCQGSVQFIIKRDPKGRFSFASLQSDYGRHVLSELKLDPHHLQSIILLTPNGVYQRSRAALEIARYLTGLWPFFYGFRIIPAGIRDLVYDWIARNRYRWFGRTETCWLPTPELRTRFIDV